MLCIFVVPHRTIKMLCIFAISGQKIEMLSAIVVSDRTTKMLYIIQFVMQDKVSARSQLKRQKY
jgi:hypothetical protein